MSPEPPTKNQESNPEISIARIGMISAVVVAVCGLLGTLATVLGTAISAYFTTQSARDPLLIPLRATQTAEARAPLPILVETAPPEPTAADPMATAVNTILVRNRLVLPVRLLSSGVLLAELPAGSDVTLMLPVYPGRLDWLVVKETTSSGRGLGDEMAGWFDSVATGQVLEIYRLAGDQEFFYPRITNNTSQDCEKTVNKGWESENATGAVVLAGGEQVGLGYFKLFTNSNVTLVCGEQEYWWGLQPQETADGSFYERVEASSGLVEFTLEP